MKIQEVTDSLVLKGKPLVEKMRLDQMAKIKEIKEWGEPPSLLVFANLEHAPSKLYVGKKIDYCHSLGLKADVVNLAATTEFEAIKILDKSRDFVLVQLPLPEKHKNLDKRVPASRDVEGFNPKHLGNLMTGNSNLYPCAAAAIVNLLGYYKFEFKGARICIINDSLVVGKPLAIALSNLRATPIICNKYTKDLSDLTRACDLIVTAVGHSDFSLKSDMITEGTWVVDAGCRKLECGKVVGDLEPEARSKCGAFTPTIGGVGPVTVAQVVSNMVQLKS